MLSFSDLIRQKRRLNVFDGSLILIGLILAVRLADLQIVHRDYYLALAAGEHQHKYTIAATRGNLYWLDGDKKSPLALDQPLKLLYADPTFINDKLGTAQKLASLTGDQPGDLVAAFNKPGSYVVLKQRVSQDLAARIAALNLDGIGLADQQYRIYPEGTLGSQVVGFVNSDGDGQYGLESFFNASLAGTPGLLKAKTDTHGIPIATADNVIKPPQNGANYTLTIDRNIQSQAEKYLDEGVRAVGAISGSIVIVDPHTGAVLAMANYPTYDANNFSAVTDYSLFRNDVVSNQFEPGSGFKVFTMATGLDTGKVSPDTTFTDPGSVEVSGQTIRNASNHVFGLQTMLQVIQNSVNTGAVFVLRSLGGDVNNITLAGKKLLNDYFTKHFNFGTRTGVEQPNEAAGQVNPPTAYDVNYANMTFGQGISVTVMQMVMAVAAIANGGTLYQPHLVRDYTTADGKTVTTAPKVVNSKVVTPATAKALLPMMEAVVEHGSGYLTKIPGYKVAGKTGTAQIPKADGTGYDETKNIGSFVGFAPADDPKFVMMVRINEPKISGFAESTTVPVFANVAKWLLHYWAIPPAS